MLLLMSVKAANQYQIISNQQRISCMYGWRKENGNKILVPFLILGQNTNFLLCFLFPHIFSPIYFPQFLLIQT